MNLILELIFAKVNDLLKALHKYFDTLISDQDKAKSFQEAESVLVSHSPKLPPPHAPLHKDKGVRFFKNGCNRERCKVFATNGVKQGMEGT